MALTEPMVKALKFFAAGWAIHQERLVRGIDLLDPTVVAALLRAQHLSCSNGWYGITPTGRAALAEWREAQCESGH